MKIISFGKTTPALVAGHKTVTRREWATKHANSFHSGEQVQAWSQSPRVPGAKRVATIRLTQRPYLEATWNIPVSDWEAEGFEYMTQHGLEIEGGPPIELWDRWRGARGTFLWVVRFELVELWG